MKPPYYIYLTIIPYVYPESVNYAVQYDLSFWGYFSSLIIASVSEELIFRYWAYGKNIKLQFSLFLSFLSYLLIDIIEAFIYPILSFTNNVYTNGNIKALTVLLIGVTVYRIIYNYNFEIPKWFRGFTTSNFSYLFIIFIFALVHVYGKEFLEYDYYDYSIYICLSYIITKHAKLFGVSYSILIHIVINSIALLNDLVLVRASSSKLVPVYLMVGYLIISITFTSLYLFKIFKIKSNKTKG